MTNTTNHVPADSPAEPLLTPGEALAKLYLDNADRGCNAENDVFVEELLKRRGQARRSLAPAGDDPMAGDQSHRFVLTGHDPEGRNRTIILWRETDLIDGRVVRRVVVTLDATMTTATVLTFPEAVQVAQAILEAAR
ncbi:MAG: hypothetical protein ACRDS1_05715 [Pseudonocardiaceae bacterium]